MFDLSYHQQIYIRQRKELAELFGFETRNKYEIDDENGKPLAFAAEKSTGLFGAIARIYFGHWRKFSIHLFDTNKNLILEAKHPFRFFFQRLEVYQADGVYIGALQQKFSIFSKKFILEDNSGKELLFVNSPFWKIWTFIFKDDRGVEVSRVEKKWSGGLKEIFTDADNFRLKFTENRLSQNIQNILLASCLFIDLQYFEKKAR